MKRYILPTTVMAAVGAALLLSFASPSVRAQEAAAASSQRQQWEYRVLRIQDRQRSGGRESDVRARRSPSEETLNQLGAEGWELVAVRNDGTANDPVFYFKRPKQ